MDQRKPGPNASSSDDLDRARSSSRRLRGVAEPTPAAKQGYVTFAPRAPPAAAAPAAPRVARVTPPPPPRPSSVPLLTRREPLKGPTAGFGPEGWNKLLDACAQTTAAEAAFLMDPHGLIIASRGPRAGDDLEVIGARLMVAFEQADRIGGDTGSSTLSMSVELPRGTLHGLRLAQPDGVLTLGLIVPGGLSAERQSRLMTLLAAAE